MCVCEVCSLEAQLSVYQLQLAFSGMSIDDSAASVAPQRVELSPTPGPSTATITTATAPPESSTEVDSEKLAQLMGMGFDGEKAIEALRRFNNDFSEAVSHLLNNQIAAPSSQP